MDSENIFPNIVENLEKKASNMKSDSFISTGIENLKFHKGDLIVLAAVPYAGKTAFAVNLLNWLSIQQNVPVGYITCGLTDSTDIAQRLLSVISKIEYEKIRTASLSTVEIAQLKDIAEKNKNSPFYIYDCPNIDFAQFECAIKNIVQTKNAKLIIIDYLERFYELLEAVDRIEEYYAYDDIEQCENGSIFYSANEKITTLLEKIKNTAQTLNVPIVLLTRLDDSKKYLPVYLVADMILSLFKHHGSGTGVNDCSVFTGKNNHGDYYGFSFKFNPRTQEFVID